MPNFYTKMRFFRQLFSLKKNTNFPLKFFCLFYMKNKTKTYFFGSNLSFFLLNFHFWCFFRVFFRVFSCFFRYFSVQIGECRLILRICREFRRFRTELRFRISKKPNLIQILTRYAFFFVLSKIGLLLIKIGHLLIKFEFLLSNLVFFRFFCSIFFHFSLFFRFF
jgi:hypothetical protein